MTKVETFEFDAANYIKTPEDVAAFLDAALEDGDPLVIADMLDAIARSEVMSGAAVATGLSQESLREALGADGGSTLSKMLQLLNVLGFRLSVTEQKTAA